MTDRTLQIPDDDVASWRRRRLRAAGFDAALAEPSLTTARWTSTRCSRSSTAAARRTSRRASSRRSTRSTGRARAPPARRTVTAPRSPRPRRLRTTPSPHALARAAWARAGGRGRTTRPSPGCTGSRCAARTSSSHRRPRCHTAGGELEDLAHQSADDALMAILRKLDGYRGAEPLHDVGVQVRAARGGVKLRRRAWQGREVGLAPSTGAGRRPRPLGQDVAEQRRAARGSARRSTPRSRRISARCCSPSRLTACRSTCWPSALSTRRGALYKSLHDARRKLRARLARAGSRSTTSRDGRVMTRPIDDREPLDAAARPGRARGHAARSASSSSTATSSSSSPASDADAAVPGMRAHLEGCPACAEDHASLRALLAAGG